MKKHYLQEKINIAEDARGVVFSKVPYVKCTEGGKHRPRLVSQQSNHHRRQSTKTISEPISLNSAGVLQDGGTTNSQYAFSVDHPQDPSNFREIGPKNI